MELGLRKYFDVDSRDGWFLPLMIPIILWWLATNSTLKTTGLYGDYQNKVNAIDNIVTYTHTIEKFSDEPVIMLYNKRDGNREARLVVRTMQYEAVVDDVFRPFIFPALMAILFAAWVGAMIIRFKTDTGDHWRKYASDVLMLGNSLAIISFVGINNVLVHFAK